MNEKSNPYALIAAALLGAGLSILTKPQGISKPLAASRQFHRAAKGRAMVNVLASDEHQFVEHALKCAQIIHTWILEAPEGTEVAKLVLNRDWLLALCEQLCPPKPTWEAPIVPISSHVRYKPSFSEVG